MEPLLFGAAILNIYAIALILVRAPIFHVPLYRPMLWNIWLSILPILILAVGGLLGLALIFLVPIIGYIILIITGISWLLTLPNASYLITELNLSHRKESDPVPIWYDIILVISLAMSGVVNTIVNVFLTHLLFALFIFGDNGAALTKPVVLISVAAVLLLLGIGMYLGRYPRFNSWDIRHPISFFKKLQAHFSNPKNVAAVAGFAITYSVFLAIMYYTIAGSIIQGIFNVEHVRDLV